MSEHPLDVLCFGEVVTDCFPDGRELLGGAPMNVAVHLRRLGCQSALLTAVGGDSLGQRTRDFLLAEGLAGTLQQNDSPTGRVRIALRPGGHDFFIEEGSAWENIQPPSPPLPAQILVFGTLCCKSATNRKTLDSLLGGKHPQSMGNTSPRPLAVCDLNIRAPFFGKEICTWCLERCTVLKISDTELETISAFYDLAGSPAQRLENLATRFSLQQIVLTLGADGAHHWCPEGHTQVPAAPLERVIDTVGAGDSFLAAFLYGLLRGNPTEESLARAGVFAAGICGIAGCLPPADWSGYSAMMDSSR